MNKYKFFFSTISKVLIIKVRKKIFLSFYIGTKKTNKPKKPKKNPNSTIVDGRTGAIRAWESNLI